MTDDVVDNCLRKANASLESAVDLLADGHHDDAANRAYYALYHAAEAALIFRGVDPTSHRHLQSQFYHHLVQPGLVPAAWHKLIIRAYEDRLLGDYSRVSSVSEQSVAAVIEEATAILPMLAELAGATKG